LPWGHLHAGDHPEGYRGSVARDLGVLAAMIRPHEAAGHFEAAVAANVEAGSRLWVARTQHDYARVLLAAGEAERGRQLLDAALATYRELGMTAYAEAASELLSSGAEAHQQ